MKIFPTLIGKWIATNLNADSRALGWDFYDPQVCQEWINSLCAANKADYVFGGYLEDRTYLWRNSSTEKALSLIHLGIDYSVPSGTPVAMPSGGELVYILLDPKNNIGWDGRLLFRLDDRKYLLYGHL